MSLHYFKMPLKAIIWDMDGVIVDSGSLHFKAWQELVVEKGVDLSEEEFKKTFGMRNPDILKALFGELSHQEITHLSNKKEEKFRRLAKLGIKALPGVVILLKSIKEDGFKQAIASSTPLQNIKLILDTLNIENFFDAIVSAEDVTHGKPDPESFLVAAKRLNVLPEECVVIEDAVAGIMAAKNAGMKSIGVTNTVSKSKLFLADLVVDNLEQVNVDTIFSLVKY